MTATVLSALPSDKGKNSEDSGEGKESKDAKEGTESNEEWSLQFF